MNPPNPTSPKASQVEKEHEHKWNYIGPYERVCKNCKDEQIYHTDQCCGEGWGH